MTNNVTHEEVDKFTEDKAQWWNLHGPLRTLHHINPTRTQYIESHIQLSGLNVLDIGCGGGILSESLAKRGANVTAIDANKSAIDVAKQHALENGLNINYVCTLAEDFAVNNKQSFDVISCLELLEHVPQPESVIKTCASLLKPGGKLFLSTINRTMKAYLLAIVGAEYVLNLIPKKTHDYDKFIKPSEMQAWLLKHGFTLDDLSGMSYNPISKKSSINEQVDVNYLMCATR